MPPKVMPPVQRKLLKYEFNEDTPLDMGCTAKEGVLQTLKLPKRDNSCINWGPDFTAVEGTRLQDGLLQPNQQLYQQFAHCRLE